MFCDNLEGWDGMGGGRELKEGGEVCVLVADSYWRTAETNTTLESNYPPIKNKLKKEIEPYQIPRNPYPAR